MKQTSVNEEIIVTANTPTIDVKGSQTGTRHLFDRTDPNAAGGSRH